MATTRGYALVSWHRDCGAYLPAMFNRWDRYAFATEAGALRQRDTWHKWGDETVYLSVENWC